MEKRDRYYIIQRDSNRENYISEYVDMTYMKKMGKNFFGRLFSWQQLLLWFDNHWLKWVDGEQKGIEHIEVY